jgi:cupin 2 domain-containing protein
LGSLFDDLPLAGAPGEAFTDLLCRPGARLERIVSTGQATASGQWLEQDWDEWVLVIQGSAGVTLEGEPALILRPGDYLWIPSGRRHRVDWTGADPPTIWLALHLT